MRFNEFCNKDNEIHFLKFMIDKAWLLVQKEAKNQQQIAATKSNTKRIKKRNQILKSRMSRDVPINYSATRPLIKNKPKLY